MTAQRDRLARDFQKQLIERGAQAINELIADGRLQYGPSRKIERKTLTRRIAREAVEQQEKIMRPSEIEHASWCDCASCVANDRYQYWHKRDYNWYENWVE